MNTNPPANSVPSTQAVKPYQPPIPAPRYNAAPSSPPPSPSSSAPSPQSAPQKSFLPSLSKSQLMIMAGIVISTLSLTGVLFLIGNRLSTSGKAKNSGSSKGLSKENSYVFASPVTAFADGISIIRVTVFILNNQGLGIVGQNVKLKTSGPLTVSSVKPVTDTYGRAIFDVTSNTPGNYTISAEISGASLSQTVSVSYQ